MEWVWRDACGVVPMDIHQGRGCNGASDLGCEKAFVEIQAKLYKCGLIYRQGMRNTRMFVGAF
jgi:hypothetical protein